MPLVTFEAWTNNADGPKHAKDVGEMIREATHEDPVLSSTIELSLGIAGCAVRQAVHYLRTTGFPIGSEGKGYFWAKSAEELDLTIKHGEQRARSISEWTEALVVTRALLSSSTIGSDSFYIDRKSDAQQ